MTWGMIGAAAVTTVGGSLLSDGGSGGGSSGGSAPPVYIPQNLQGMDQNLLDAYKSYQSKVASNYQQTDPLNNQLLQQQYNNPYQQYMLDRSNDASRAYDTSGTAASLGQERMFMNANGLANLQNSIGQSFAGNGSNVQNSVNTMYGMGQQSNQTFADLINRERAQSGNVQQASNNLYGMGNDASNMTRQLVNYQTGQMGNITNASNQLYGEGSRALNTAEGLARSQQAQGGNVQGASNDLYGAARSVRDSAFDPRQNIYNQNKQDLVENVRASEAARGIEQTPYGASVEADALGRFQNDWQNQQLSRQAQGIGAMSGADQSAQGLSANWANNVAGLQGQGVNTASNANQSALGLNNSLANNISSIQGQGVNTVSNAGQSALGMNNSYANNIAGLVGGMNQNYMNLSTGANNMMNSYLGAEAGTAAQMANAVGHEYQTMAGLGNSGAQMYAAAGQAPYGAQNQIYGDQNQALQNFNTNNQPYFSGLNQLQSNSMGYMNYGQGAQNMAWGQNNANNQAFNQNVARLSGPISQGIQSIFGGRSNDYGGYGNMNGYSGSGYDPGYTDGSLTGGWTVG